MTTEERLEKVERELAATKRRSRWLLAALGLGLGVLALVWASAASVPSAEAQGAVSGRTVRANMFILEDENGKTRAVLAVTADGAGLFLRDATGKSRAMLVVGKDGPLLSLCDAAGTLRAMLDAGKDEARLSLCDENGTLRAMLSVGGPMLVPADESGNLAMLSAVKAGARLNMSDENGKRIWSAP